MPTNNEDNRIGKNIKALREAYRETQEDLASLMGLDRKAISNYENGKREVDDQKKELIAKHYMVSVQELMYSDLSTYNLNFSIDNANAQVNAIYDLYPIFATEESLMDSNFAEAYSRQCKLYNFSKEIKLESFLKDSINIKKLLSNNNDKTEYFKNILDLLTTPPIKYLDPYINSITNNKMQLETAANYISMYHYLRSSEQSLSVLFDKTAIIGLMSKEIHNELPSVETKLSSIANLPQKELISVLSHTALLNIEIKDQHYLSQLDEMMKILHHSPEYSELANYYDALEFVNNIIDNNSEWTANKRNGYDMLKRCAKRGNIYAQRYLKYCPDTID